MADLRTRQRQNEWMDEPDVDPVDLSRSLRFIQRVNSLLRYTRATISHLERFSRNWKKGETIRIVDFATGSADIPRAILKWADARRLDVRIVAIDLHATTLHIAANESNDPRLSFVRADATAAPFADDSFDYALTAMFLHHLSDDDAVRVLREMNRVSRRGIIAADLLRNARAYFWISLLTTFSDAMIRHDARISIQQAFSRAEVLNMRARAGIEFASYHRHFGHRFVLAGEK